MNELDAENNGHVATQGHVAIGAQPITYQEREVCQAGPSDDDTPSEDDLTGATVDLPGFPLPMCEPEAMEHILGAICTDIASQRQRPLFVLMSDKITLRTFLTVTLWRKALSTIGSHSGFDVLLQSPGGDLGSCYQIARVFAKFTKSWEALVPFYAASGATLISLGSSNIVLSDFAQLGPLDPQVISKRASKFFYAERQSPLEAFQAVKYLRRSALETMNATMLYLLTEQGVAPQMAIETASKFSVELTKPILEKIDPYDLGSFAQDDALALDYSQRICRPSDSGIIAQREAQFSELVQRYTAHEFVIDFDEARSLGLQVQKPSDKLEDLFEGFRAASLNGAELIGLYLPATEEGASYEENCESTDNSDDTSA